MSVPTDVMAQMGFGVADEGAEERMRGVASKLRGDRNLGQFFQLSGSQNTRDIGKGMVGSSERGITEIGQRRAQGLTRAAQKARDDEAKRQAAYREGKDVTDAELAAEKYEKAQGRLDTQAGLAEEALQYQRQQEGQEMATSMQALETSERERAEDERNKREAVAIKHANDLEAQGLKDEAAKLRAEIKADAEIAGSNMMPNAEKSKYRIATHAVETIPGILAKAAANEDAFGPSQDVVGFLPDGTPNFITKTVKGVQGSQLTDEEQEARAAVLNQSFQIIHSLAGSALSKAEEDRIDAFTPAPGDTFRMVMSKLREAEEYARGKHESFRMYSDYTPYAGYEEEAAAVEAEGAVEEVDAEARKEELRAKIAALKGGEAVATPLPQQEAIVPRPIAGGRSRVPPQAPRPAVPAVRAPNPRRYTSPSANAQPGLPKARAGRYGG